MTTLGSPRRGWWLRAARALAGSFAIALTSGAAQAALITPPGLQPGDTYQLAFVTSGTFKATSGDIAEYDALVQAAAAAAGMGSVTWRVIGSTLGVSAIDHAVVSAPVYNMNGALVATGFTDFWDGDHADDLDYDEFNAARNFNVWTGTLGTGASGGSGAALGEAQPWWGESTLNASQSWTQHDRQDNSVDYALYALSEPLTVVPEPGIVWLLAVAPLGLVGRALLRRRARR
jgi:hypothetical protein